MAMCLIYAVLAVLAAAGGTTENDRRTIEGVPIEKGPAPVDVEGGGGASAADDEADDDDDPELMELEASLPVLSRRTSEKKCEKAEVSIPKGFWDEPEDPPWYNNWCARLAILLFCIPCCVQCCGPNVVECCGSIADEIGMCCLCGVCVLHLIVLPYYVFGLKREDYGGCTLFNVWREDNGIGLWDLGYWCSYILLNAMLLAFCFTCVCICTFVPPLLGHATEVGSVMLTVRRNPREIVRNPRGLVRTITGSGGTGTGTGTGAANNQTPKEEVEVEIDMVGNANQV